MVSSLRVILLALSFLASGIAAAEEESPAETTAVETPPASALPTQTLTPQVLYQTILAEIAVARAQLPMAANLYLDLAKTTRDPRIARRASEIAFHARQGNTALTAARLWLELEPESAQARQYLWSLLASSGKSDELAEALSGAIRTEANPGAALLQLNRLLGGGPDKQAILRIVDKVTTPYLSLPEARFARAQAAMGAKDEMRAMAETDALLALKPDWAPAVIMKAQLLARTPEKSLEILDDYIKRQASPAEVNPDVRLVRARLLVELRRFPEARADFAGLLAERPDNPDIIYAMGLLSMQLGDGEAAEKHLRRLLTLGYAEENNARYYLAQLLEETGRTGEALEIYDSIKDKSPRYAAAQARGAALQKNGGNLEGALVRLEKAAAANPEMRSVLLVTQAQLLAEAGRNQEGLDLLGKALTAHPTDPVLMYEIGMMEEKAQRFDAMEKHMRQLIKLQPENAQAYNALGYSLVDRGIRLEEARQLLDKALSLAPDDGFILDSKGWLLFKLGNLEGAENHLRRAYAQRPDPEIAAHLGEVLWARNKQDEARTLWSTAVKQAPDNPVLTATIKRLAP